MIAETLKKHIQQALSKSGVSTGEILLEHPTELSHGDYSTNVALAYAKELKISPRDLAEKIKSEIENDMPKEVERVEIAGPGFINFFLSKEFFTDSINEIIEKGSEFGKNTKHRGKKILIEYTQPNPFKPFHIGHLMSNAIGESLSRIIESHGAKVVRANYQGDIGPHVAKAIWGILKKGGSILGESSSEQASYIGECYVLGSDAYETDEESKKEINEINKRIYAGDSELMPLYTEGRKSTLEAFEEIYKTLGTKFD
ncbi:MAG: arginine--tRNA ligase, partial [Candidatus Paceibacterota bacterium]